MALSIILPTLTKKKIRYAMTGIAMTILLVQEWAFALSDHLTLTAVSVRLMIGSQLYIVIKRIRNFSPSDASLLKRIMDLSHFRLLLSGTLFSAILKRQIQI